MKKADSIQQELADLNSSLPQLPQPYAPPPGYFEGLAESIMDRIKASEGSAETELESMSPLLAGLSRKMPNEVPPGYFEGLMQELPFIGSSEPALEGWPKNMPQQVPAGYFENLPEVLLKKVTPPKVVPMAGRRWMRMAVAAAITGIMVLAGYFYLSGSQAGGMDALARELKSVSTTELEEFINTTTSNSNGATAQNHSRKPNVEMMLEDVSDKELDAFLGQVPNGEEDLFAIN